MSNLHTRKRIEPASPPSNSVPNRWLLVSVVGACLLGGLAIVAFEMLRARPHEIGHPDNAAMGTIGTKLGEVSTAKPQAALEAASPAEDDGRTLWVSPTSGKPIDLAYLPPGSQIIVAVRLEGLSAHGEGGRVLAALGPLGERAIKYIEDTTHSIFDSIEVITMSCQATSSGEWQVAIVARAAKPWSADSLPTKLPGATSEGAGSKRYWLGGDRAYFLPEEREGRVLVVAAPALMTDIVALAGAAPPLRRDIERLLAFTDANRQLTVIVAPNFLFGEGQGMFSGAMSRLRGPLFWFLGDELSAAALSMNWDDNFFVELSAIPTLDVSPEKAAGQLAERVRQMPELIEEYVLKLDPQPYGRRVVARFPEMVRKLAAYTRGGVDDGAVVLRCYLPAVAGHNLLMGAELTLAEGATGGAVVVSSDGAASPPTDFDKLSPGETDSPGEWSVEDRLMRKTSLSFARDSLEAALELLSQDIGVEIVIVGPDLQADGITRNQQLGIHLEDQPASSILVEILRRANPDKTATSASDPRQKLVYVVKPKSDGGTEAVFVTTRARAAERGEQLPAVFRDVASK